MKKIITITMIVAAATCSFAQGYVMKGTNKVDAVEYSAKWGNSHTNCLYTALQFKDMTQQEYSICDENMSKNGNYINDFTFGKFSKSLQNFKPVAQKAYPDCYQTICEYIDGTKVPNSSNGDERTVINLYFYVRDGKYIHDTVIKQISNKSSKYAKKTIREKGESFAGESGTMKVKAYVDAVTDAFNAPKYQGLDKALKDIGMDFGMNFAFNQKYSDEEIANIKNDIMIGNKDFTRTMQQTLKAYLGVAEYNKFVKEYNGDK